MKNIIELRKLSKVYKDVTTVDLEKNHSPRGRNLRFSWTKRCRKDNNYENGTVFSNAYFWRDF